MFGLGPMELVVIAVVALVVLGPSGLAKAARELGRLVGQLRSATSTFTAPVEQMKAEVRSIAAMPTNRAPRTLPKARLAGADADEAPAPDDDPTAPAPAPTAEDDAAKRDEAPKA
ncbi:twin-arginine translocase TatA/TatE family subunit [Myxococcota bacterium]|nr:twin-arginine translocase TatA/TatE family subunit [Myxococcota bacterium]